MWIRFEGTTRMRAAAARRSVAYIGFISFFASAHEIVWPCLFFTWTIAISPTSFSSWLPTMNPQSQFTFTAVMRFTSRPFLCGNPASSTAD